MSTVILEGVRTPYGKFKGKLSELSAKQLGSIVIKELLHRVPEAEKADGVILAQVIQGGEGQNPARKAAIDAGVSLSVPAITLNNVCLAGLAAVADATRRIKLEEGEVYIVGGFDSMTNAPHAANLRRNISLGKETFKDTLDDGLWCSLTDDSMGNLTDKRNLELNISRSEQDEYALLSQQRAYEAVKKGHLQAEMVPVETKLELVKEDEGIRPHSTVEGLAKLKPVFLQNGTITAGNASQMSDGASAGIIASEAYADKIGRRPLAKIIGFADVAGPDTSLHDKPAQAIEKVLQKTNHRIEEIDLFEINEAFASVAIASCKQLAIPFEKVNVNGGAIAIGHPLGGTGFRLLLTLIHELKRRGGGKGIATLCGGGGQGTAVLIEVPKEWI
ncbi:acetyl-CoA C-acyltransferase [Cytobacillus purgationiresistens]|uniref:acetyl-CoA C-acetyltransferase n=1 Tax=Cytobacillus purgationiresistens TaxID=863449 RepID=A0ABU0ANK5_9BACI|nr:acetyl-CoA C-acyltransferase [Cytobacillus purgationiresistens]MDQ0272874.1 acetyl-CoA C-acetyltransferase [Cytobacillus purgationiresistens]